MFTVITCLQHHDLPLVGAALAICIIAVAASLTAYRRAMTTLGPRRLAWMLVVALMLGSGVWATHFLAMLAYQSELGISYGPGLTAVSLLVAIGGMGSGVMIATRLQTASGRFFGGALCGASIAAMHFLGVAAMRLPASITWDAGLVAVAILLGIGGGAASFVVGKDLANLKRGAAAVALLALGIAGLHFTAMGAVTLTPGVMTAPQAGLYGGRDLAIAVGVLAIIILASGCAVLAMDRFSVSAAYAGLRSALNGAPSAFAFFDPSGRLMFWNEAYARILRHFGMTPTTGLAFRTIVETAAAAGLPEDIAAQALEPSLREGRSLNIFSVPNGSSFQTAMQPTEDGGFAVVVTDITEQLEFTRREAEARRHAEAASRAKSEFLANMSHEIRTPLNGVLGMVQVMSRDALADEQRERLEVIGSAGHALLSILNSVLDISKIESGKLELEDGPFDLGETVDLVVAAYAPLAAQKQVSLEVELPVESRGVWRGDGVRLRQVLYNLISNAVKFTAEGTIRLTVAPTGDGLAFQISDTGLGVPADKLELIFDKFTQADASTTRRFGGTGLGLAICRELVRLMGGELDVVSEEGRGSTFAFAIPLARTEAAPDSLRAEPVALHADNGALRILAAEDNPTNQLVLAALLKPLGVEITVADSGRAAVEAFAPGRFDLVLMDAQMPEMNGIEAAIEIRRRERQAGASPTPIIALTANVMRHQVDEYLQAGMNGVVAKPIEAAALFGAIESALAAPAVTQAA